MSTLWFSLDKPEHVYNCGERIKGTLCVENESPLNIAGVEIRFRGIARACWREAPYYDRKSSEVEHEKEEIYFDDRFCLWGRVSSTSGWVGSDKLPVGTHVFPFQYRLPANQPTSFEGMKGAVRYSMLGLLIIPDGKHVTTELHFTVVKPTDICTDGINGVLEDYIERSVTDGCCGRGRVRCSLQILKRFYVPGERIIVTVNVENNSNKKCGQCLAHINQLVTFGGVHRYSVVIASVKLADRIVCGENGKWTDGLLIPATCPSVLDPTRLIVATYCVSMEVEYGDETLHTAVPILLTLQPDDAFRNAPWSYKACQQLVPVEDEYSDDSDKETDGFNHEVYQPMYKYYELDHSKMRINILPHSPGVSRRRREIMRDNSREPRLTPETRDKEGQLLNKIHTLAESFA